MSLLTVAAIVAAALLVPAGIAKARRPGPTVAALALFGPAPAPGLVRGAAAGEVALGLAALAGGAPGVWVAVGLSYVAFAAFVALMIAQGDRARSCGCFGAEAGPPGRGHLVLNLAAAAAALAAGALAPPPLPEVLADQPLAGVPFALLAAAGTAGVALALTWLPRLSALRRPA